MIRAEALAGALKAMQARGLPPVVWIASDEALLRQEAADAVRAAARTQGFDERTVFHVERGFKLEQLFAETQALSLFASRRLLELRIPGKPGKELGDGLAQALASLPELTAKALARWPPHAGLPEGTSDATFTSRNERMSATSGASTTVAPSVVIFMVVLSCVMRPSRSCAAKAGR